MCHCGGIALPWYFPNDFRLTCFPVPVLFEYRQLCGCNNEAPEDGCKLCDGPLVYPDRISYDLYGEVYTCQEDAEYVPYAYSREDKECMAMRSVVGSYCGCESAPPKECSICPEGGSIQMVNSPNFTYVDPFLGQQDVYNENCVDVEYIVNLGASAGRVEEECAEISAQVASECCLLDGKGVSNNFDTSRGSLNRPSPGSWAVGIVISTLIYCAKFR